MNEQIDLSDTNGISKEVERQISEDGTLTISTKPSLLNLTTDDLERACLGRWRDGAFELNRYSFLKRFGMDISAESVDFLLVVVSSGDEDVELLYPEQSPKMFSVH